MTDKHIYNIYKVNTKKKGQADPIVHLCTIVLSEKLYGHVQKVWYASRVFTKLSSDFDWWPSFGTRKTQSQTRPKDQKDKHSELVL